MERLSLSDLFQLIIFDLDDTLIHSSINYSEIRLKLIELFPDEYKPSFKDRNPLLQLLKNLKGISEELYEQGKLIVEKSERNAAKNAVIMKGAEIIPSLLEQFNLKGLIYTNNSNDTVNLYRENPEFSFLSQFQIVTRDDVKKPKPHPEGLLQIISRFKIPKSDVIYIGDSFIDSEAANRADIKFILFNSRKLDPISFDSAPFSIINHWYEFEVFLNTYLKAKDN